MYSMSFSTLLRISRPRFRHYVLWPMLLLFAVSWFLTNRIYIPWLSHDQTMNVLICRIIALVIIGGYFTLPANLWIYGRNDIADGDTDIHNAKKGEYENLLLTNKTSLKICIIAINILYIFFGALVFTYVDFYYATWNILYTSFRGSVGEYNRIAYVCLIPFFITSYLYSCPPLRAKALPFIDGIMNILYIITPFTLILWIDREFSYMIFSLHHALPIAIASLCRCMAMHCYSAIPDIDADRQAWLTTTAVYLGKQKALIYCGILYLVSAIFSFPTLWWMSIVGGVVYLTMISISYCYEDIFWLYKKFPLINLIIGFSLFRYILLF